MNTIKKLLPVILFWLIFFGVLLHPWFNGKHRLLSYYHYLVWGDVIKVEISEKLDKNKIEVIFKNDLQLTLEKDPFMIKHTMFRKDYQPRKITVYNQGKQIYQIPYEYGPQVLVVYYDGKEVGKIDLWRTNHFHTHRYYISLSGEDGRVNFNGYVEGPDVR
ncbi:MAG: hypothetical protein ACK40G_11860 [Cytophagaceae bacterium]